MPATGAMSWLPFTLGLTGAGLFLSWLAWRRWGIGAGLRGVALSLLPPAAYLTGLFQLVWRIGGAALDWALGLAFSPAVWIGVALLGFSAVLYAVSARLRARAPRRRGRVSPAAAANREVAPPARTAPAADNEFADIEEILRRRGIS
jgi:hypothetical protein